VVLARKLEANKEALAALEAEAKEAYAVGDCVAPRKALNAIHDGFRIGTRI
jgi:hypothetical protein